MAKNEDLNQANQGAPAMDIPDLKQKEKERKKAGAAWGGVKPGASPFSGATGGNVARAAASAAGAGSPAAGSAIAGFAATVLGKTLIAAGLAAFVLGGGFMAMSMMRGGGAMGTGDLGAISSSMKIRQGGGDRTGYVASKGEIMFDPVKKAEAPKAPEKAPEQQTAGDAVPPAEPAAEKPDWRQAAGGLEHNLSGSKLSSSLGGGFGGKNIFQGNPNAPKFNEGMAKSSLASKGKLGAMKSAKTGKVVRGAQAQRQRSSKAFGQLKIAKGMSMLGAGNNSAEGARSTAGNAFDGAIGNGNVEGGPGAPGGAVTSPSSNGGGAPDVSAPNVDVPTGNFMDGNQAAMVAMIAEMAKAAGEMRKKAETLMWIGIGLVAAGCCLLWWPATPIGIALIAIGAALIAASVMMKEMAAMMESMASGMSESLAARTGDENQNRINQYCIDKAYNEGVDPKDCNPPDDVTHASQFNSVQQNGNTLHTEHNTTNGNIRSDRTDPRTNGQGLP